MYCLPLSTIVNLLADNLAGSAVDTVKVLTDILLLHLCEMKKKSHQISATIRAKSATRPFPPLYTPAKARLCLRSAATETTVMGGWFRALRGLVYRASKGISAHKST